MTIADLLGRSRRARVMQLLSEAHAIDFCRIVAIAMILILVISGTSSSTAAYRFRGSEATPARANLAIAGPEIWARTGAPLVLPYEPTEPQIRAGMVPARLHDGSVLFAPLVWIGPAQTSTRKAPTAAPSQNEGAALIAQRAAAWMDIETEWESLTSAAALRLAALPATGHWYLVIDVPPESSGRDIVLDGHRLTTGWIRQAPFAAPRRAPAASVGWGGACLSAARRSPLTRWRARLASGEPLVATGPAPDEFVDQNIESLAEQIEAQWAEALNRLAAVDSALAADLRSRLVLGLEFNGIEVPAWPADDLSSNRLQQDLLNPLHTGAVRSQRTREWLQGLPRVAAWIADDAAIIDQSSGRPAAIVAGASLVPGAGPVAMMLSRPGAVRPQEIATLNPGIVGRSLLALTDSPADESSIAINVGGWSARRAVVPNPLPARPPGVSLGSFFRDWSLPVWRASCTDDGDTRAGQSPAGRGAAVSGDGSHTAALLLAQQPVGAGPGAAGQRQWMLYIECQSDAIELPSQSDEVLISLSGKGGDIALRVYADGQIVNSRGGSSRITTHRDDKRWMAWVPLPEDTIADGAWIRLGVSRTNPTGMRSTWPRPMFPWESQLPHAAINLSEWGGITDKPR